MELDERKLKILQAVIHNYITNAEPVGSRTISKKYNLGVSSATIRNEMSDLEELGYLVQPHTSAGRVPSDKAYRLYVDCLMKERYLTNEEREMIRKAILNEMGEIDTTIQNVAKILSQLTNYTSLVLAPQVKQSKLKHIQLVPINENKVLVVIVNDTDIVRNVIFRVDKEIPYAQLNKISNLLTDKLKGHRIGEISCELKDSLVNEMYDLRDTIRSAIDTIAPIISQSLEKEKEVNLYANGVTNIFNFPEYNDITKARAFLSFLENKESVIDMMLRTGQHDLEISIGSENIYKEVKNCSLITATYKINGKTVGKIGVIGPTRMDYSKVIAIVKSMAHDMNEILNKYFAE